jgi:hypothetical protein
MHTFIIRHGPTYKKNPCKIKMSKTRKILKRLSYLIFNIVTSYNIRIRDINIYTSPIERCKITAKLLYRYLTYVLCSKINMILDVNKLTRWNEKKETRKNSIKRAINYGKLIRTEQKKLKDNKRHEINIYITHSSIYQHFIYGLTKINNKIRIKKGSVSYYFIKKNKLFYNYNVKKIYF